MITLSPGLRLAGIGRYAHWCPGCDAPHFFVLQGPDDQLPARTFRYNGDIDKPTFVPCQNVPTPDGAGVCHYYLSNGELQFMGDCTHAFRNRTVPLPTFPHVDRTPPQ